MQLCKETSSVRDGPVECHDVPTDIYRPAADAWGQYCVIAFDEILDGESIFGIQSIDSRMLQFGRPASQSGHGHGRKHSDAAINQRRTHFQFKNKTFNLVKILFLKCCGRFLKTDDFHYAPVGSCQSTAKRTCQINRWKAESIRTGKEGLVSTFGSHQNSG